MKTQKTSKKIRYAVVGLGHIAQKAVLPAFKNAKENSELVALISSDDVKLRELKKRYKVPYTGHYRDFDRLMDEAKVDAVYIALPNNMHREFTILAAQKGIHVLCEKPMAVTSEDCLDMIDAARSHQIKLMIAYRLHFDPANLEAIKIVQSKRLGEIKAFHSIFTFEITNPKNIRLKHDLGGGTLYDIGIYCVNAVRHLFQEEPIEVTAVSGRSSDKRFKEIDEIASAVLKFSNGKLATFTTSFGSAVSSTYEVIGTKGKLKLDNAYEYIEPIEMTLTMNEKSKKKKFKVNDQFAPELIYFSNCILKNKDPEPSGFEGLLDVQIIEALYRSAREGRTVPLKLAAKGQSLLKNPKFKKPAVEDAPEIHVSPPHD